MLMDFLVIYRIEIENSKLKCRTSFNGEVRQKTNEYRRARLGQATRAKSSHAFLSLIRLLIGYFKRECLLIGRNCSYLETLSISRKKPEWLS